MTQFTDAAFTPDACPHVAILLSRADEVPGALAAFYSLGVKRYGWMYHRSLAGHAAGDREALTAAGLDVAALEAEGRMSFSEMDPRVSVEEYVHGSDAEMDAALARGYDAVWCSRFPVGPDAAFVERALAFDRAWEAHAHDRRYVSLCIYVMGEADRDRRARELAAIHDTVITGSPTRSATAPAK
ncbi:hypothetical protein [Solirubrobacter soli]|uniref:hypothetical protein n=1 Tax=Solirubrobacter soli TaxID=363832 RepID=UPI0003FE7725|nr:hypothetical protein [Solirubrobacter soli]